MSTAIVPINQQGEVAVNPQEMTLESFAMMMAKDPALDAQKLQTIMVMLQQGRAEQRREKFFDALKRVQDKAPRITKHGLMDRGQNKGLITYAKREDIDAVMRPIYQAEGFSVNWDAPSNDGKIRVVGRFTAHGHTEEREWSCSPDTSGGKQNPQAVNSTVSYGQRTISIMFWDIITEDADKNGQKLEDLEPIKQAQADDIRDSLVEIKANMEKFYKVFGVTKLEEIKVGQLKEVWARINAVKAQR